MESKRELSIARDQGSPQILTKWWTRASTGRCKLQGSVARRYSCENSAAIAIPRKRRRQVPARDRSLAANMAKNSAVRKAGRYCQIVSAGSAPVFAISCAAPAGITTEAPGPANCNFPSIRIKRVPATTLTSSSCFGCS